MKRCMKWLVICLLGGWLLVATAVALLGFEYVYAFEIVPLWHEEDQPRVELTSVPEARWPRPREPAEPIRIDVHGSPGPGLRFLKCCLHVQNPDFYLFTRDGSDEIELYVISHERDGKIEVHKAVFVGMRHQHDQARMVVLE